MKNFDEETNRLLNKTTEYLNEVEYPADRGDLLRAARSREAPPAVLAVLEQLPEKTYASHNDLLALFVDADETSAGRSQRGRKSSKYGFFLGLRQFLGGE